MEQQKMKKTTRSKATKKKSAPKLKIVKMAKEPTKPQTPHPFSKFIMHEQYLPAQNMYAHNNIRARRRIA